MREDEYEYGCEDECEDEYEGASSAVVRDMIVS